MLTLATAAQVATIISLFVGIGALFIAVKSYRDRKTKT